MANVTMDLNELDKLRSDLKEKDNIIKDKDDEIAELKSNKRSVRITSKMIPKQVNNFSNVYWSFNGRYDPNEEKLRSIINRNINITKAVRETYEFCTSKATELLEEKTSTEYVNYDDVIQDIRSNIDKSVTEELATLKNEIRDLTIKLSDANQKEKEVIEALKKAHVKELDEKDEKYEKLNKEFNSFREGRDLVTLQKKIDDLQAELTVEKSKKWWQKL